MDIINNIQFIIEEIEYKSLNIDIDPEDEYLLEGNEDYLDYSLNEALIEIGFDSVNEGLIASSIRGSIRGYRNPSAGSDFGSFLAAIGIAGAVVVLAGGLAYAIISYIGSIYRLNRVVNTYKKNISETTDPVKKAELTKKLHRYIIRLNIAKANAREKKKDFIIDTNKMKIDLDKMKKDGKDTTELQKKLDARMKVMSKIGAV